jgi:putative addiction module component (TIGR02574 family)
MKTVARSGRKTESEWKMEIDRRLRELESGAVKGMPLEKTKQRIERTFKRSVNRRKG